MKLILTVGVQYKPNGETAEQLSARLERIAQFLYDQGMLTGDSPAEIESWTYAVREDRAGGGLDLNI